MVIEEVSIWTTVTKQKKRKLRKITEVNLRNAIDDIYKFIYNLLLSTPRLPASFITKKVNESFGTRFTKRDIGQILYESKLTKFLVSQGHQPVLWSIKTDF